MLCGPAEEGPMAAQLLAIDLYSGCGGLSWGLRVAGFTVVAAVEVDPVAAESYRLNHPTVTLLERDVREVTPHGLCGEADVLPSEVTLLAACAPCQYFSRQNRRHATDDGWLVERFAEFVEALLPPVIFMENVPELEVGRGEATYRNLTNRLSVLGYRVVAGRLNTADYGVAQHRRRLTLVGSRNADIPVVLPAPTHVAPVETRLLQKKPWRTVRDAIGHLPPIEAGEQSSYHPLHWASSLSPLNLERLRHVPLDGGDRRTLPEQLQLQCHKSIHGYTDTYGRLWWDQPARTLTTGFLSITKGRYGHPEQLRGLSLLEGALLQGFPETYKFVGSRTAIARQIGNAVPPVFAGAILSPMATALAGNRLSYMLVGS